MEQAGISAGKRYTPLTLSDSPKKHKSQDSVVHINGYIDQLDTSTLENSFKLTNTSYLTQQFRASAWSEVFIREIQAAHAVFFVGYSLYDIDIQEILFSEKRIREKTFFIQRLQSNAPATEDSDLSDFGEIMPIGINRFSHDLMSVDPLAISDSSELILTSFDEVLTTSQSNANIRDEDVHSLLLRGEIKNDIVADRVLRKKRDDYILQRDCERSILSSLESESKNNILIYGDMANGKTLLAKAICAQILADGYRVFWLRDEAYSCLDEIEKILSLKEKTAIVFENYNSKLNLIAHAGTKRQKSSILILTARSIEHERAEEDLYYAKSIISPRDTIEVCVNKLSDSDLNGLSIFIGLYGLWGGMASKSNSHKIRHLQDKCGSELHGVLIDIIKSPQMQDRIKPIFSEMSKSDPILKSMVSAFALSIININSPTMHMLAALTNDSSIFSPTFKSNPAVKQFFNRSDENIIPKSSALAEYALQNFPDTSKLIETLVDICRNTRRKAEGNQLYFDIYKNLASFRYAQKMLPENGKRDALISFYEGLRTIDLERRNPHFWLQYAIACLTFPDAKNLEHAKAYLDTGLSLAKAKYKYTTTDIETQYARYHLEYAINVIDDHKEAYSEFSKANELLISITKREKYKREAFRPARLYERIYKKFQHDFDKETCLKILNSCTEIISNIEKLPYKTRDNGTVKASYESLCEVRRAIRLRHQV